jgi:molybdopterin molybdotransferase
MLSFSDAQVRLAGAAPAPSATERCALADARGRVLAGSLRAEMNLPPVDNSAMDGYALRCADYAPDRPLPIQQRCFAGQEAQPLQPGYATRLFTGSPVPEGADTVIPQEDCVEQDGHVQCLRAPQPGAFIRRQGSDQAGGAPLLPGGTAGQPRGPAQLFDANGPMLTGLVQGIGGVVTATLHAQDDAQALRDALASLLATNDVVITVGGVSVGERDLVRATIEEHGTLDLWKVRMKPGKPVALARVGDVPVICLPGNPVSAFVVFTMLVTPLLRRMQGRRVALPPVQRLVLRTPNPCHDTREEFLRARVWPAEDGSWQVQPYPQQGSHIINSVCWADGLARIPADTVVKDGDWVDYYDLAHWLA